MYDYSPVWCCLADWEREFLAFMAGWLALPDPVVALGTYDSVWAGTVGPTGTALYLYWMDLWELTVQEIEIVPGVPVTAVVWTIPGYISLNVWLLDEGSSCPSPCPYTTGNFALPV